jgi:hypothetical protein
MGLSLEPKSRPYLVGATYWNKDHITLPLMDRVWTDTCFFFKQRE